MHKNKVTTYSETTNEIAQYIYDNFEQPITLSELSQKFGVSKYHLNRVFFAHTGMNLGEFIQRRRLEFAYSLLASQQMPVIDVAMRVGYESHAAFSRAFNRLFETEPNQVKSSSTPDFALAKLIKQPKRQAIQAEIWLCAQTVGEHSRSGLMVSLCYVTVIIRLAADWKVKRWA